MDEIYKRGEVQNIRQYRNALDKFSTQERELPSKILEQIAFNTRPKTEKHMFFVMDKSTQEDYLSQPLQTNKKQIKIAVTFLTVYNGILIVTSPNNKFYFAKSITDKDSFIQVTIPPGAYEKESLNNGIKRIIINEGQFTDSDYPFTIKLNN